jgi:hypothetical protein
MILLPRHISLTSSPLQIFLPKPGEYLRRRIQSGIESKFETTHPRGGQMISQLAPGNRESWDVLSWGRRVRICFPTVFRSSKAILISRDTQFIGSECTYKDLNSSLPNSISRVQADAASSPSSRMRLVGLTHTHPPQVN